MSILRFGLLRVTVLAVLFAAYFITCSLLIHRSYHSNGWDLGLFDQVIWNTAHGRTFQYSFRDISYAGDHWQPVLIAFAPLKWLVGGPEPLLIIQGIALAGAAVPLYLAVKRMAGVGGAWLLVLAFLLSLGVHRSVAFDFHPESLAPVLAFTALWSLVNSRRAVFTVSATAILLLKEDAVFLVLALAWISAFGFGRKRQAALVASIAMIYGAVVTLFVMPHFRGSDLNPLRERYGYLGDSIPQIASSTITHPWLVVEHLADGPKLGGALLVVLATGLLPLTVPRLLPPLVLIVALPMLSLDSGQNTLQLHYLLVPSVASFAIAAVALRDRNWERWTSRVQRARQLKRLWAAAPLVALAVLPLALFALVSPLPPSLATEYDRFDVDTHARLADQFVSDIPSGAIVSAQSPFVPHLAERTRIYQFPRVINAQFVLLDKYGPIPKEDLDAGYDACQKALPLLGFDMIREDGGIALWRKVRQPASVSAVPSYCSDGPP